MFDTVYINSTKLPISAEEQELLRDANFQTKSLDSVLEVGKHKAVTSLRLRSSVPWRYLLAVNRDGVIGFS